ncbi:SGNH/GDSL hydrolase family protein [Nocardioides bizhenqiangii]|uniref:GDSL-type esterase/lipase family protein n=1 Tax=Nocardioides bizhenqiangii TaxID=3095076 RepID=A0ABZ0ZSS4_9ACTN|nr:GDSL-type esterase/lipase family protein [Nocardioides sp. HM61]WQQ27252.1 GDSL-type esterase/lipase family protein [Nocardioides sp. HM61]
MRIRGAWLVAVGLTVAVATTGLLVMTHAGADTDRCTEFRAAARERAELVTGTGDDVLVIGDSYSVGLGVRAAESWPTRLAGRVEVDGFSGSGFSRDASSCGYLSYAVRAARSLPDEPGLVVVEGGLNDVDQPRQAIREGFAALVSALRGRQVLVVGPAPAPDRAAAVPAVDRLLARLSEEHGVGYLSMLDTDLHYLPDGLHLTADGHREFGDRVAAALSAGAARLTG